MPALNRDFHTCAAQPFLVDTIGDVVGSEDAKLRFKDLVRSNAANLWDATKELLPPVEVLYTHMSLGPSTNMVLFRIFSQSK